MKNTINKILFDNTKLEILIAPTFIHIPQVSKLLKDKTIHIAT